MIRQNLLNTLTETRWDIWECRPHGRQWHYQQTIFTHTGIYVTRSQPLSTVSVHVLRAETLMHS